jgi:plasmid stabilization system protein ParE
MKRVVIHPEAQKELEEAADYFAEHALTPTTEADFRAEIRGAFMEIAAHPERFRFALKGEPDRRFGPTKKFRYLVYYYPGDLEVLVLAVAHPSRRPGYWVGRRP